MKDTMSDCEILRTRLLLKPTKGFEYCFACDKTVPSEKFKSSKGSAVLPQKSDAEVVDLPPGICSGKTSFIL
jgi:hypothetical protein